MAEGDDGRRAAQIRAARDVIDDALDLPGALPERVAVEVVDAVNAAGISDRPARPAASGSTRSITGQATQWYAMHDHGPSTERHAHSTEQGHSGNVSNPRANDHSGVEVLPTFEDAKASWERSGEETTQDDPGRQPPSRTCPACATDPHHEPEQPHVHATTYGYAIYAPSGLSPADELRAAGYRDAITALLDTTTYKRWHQQVYATTGVDHHRWNWNNRVTLADYLEAVGPGHEDEKLTEENDG